MIKNIHSTFIVKRLFEAIIVIIVNILSNFIN